jgi:branched-chain amino acid transport system substrate-binding protein
MEESRRRNMMKLKTSLLAGAFGMAFAATAQAQVSVKIGVLSDRSGLYADISDEGSVVAARMAAEDDASTFAP